MSVFSTDSKSMIISVNNIDDVSGPTYVSPSSYAVGWRAFVRSAGPNKQRTFVVVQDISGEHVWTEQTSSLSASRYERSFAWTARLIEPNGGALETQRSYATTPMVPMINDPIAIDATLVLDNTALGGGITPLTEGIDWVLLPRNLDQSTIGPNPQSWPFPTGPHPSVASDRIGVLILPTSPELGLIVEGQSVLRFSFIESVLAIPARGAVAAFTQDTGGGVLEVSPETWRLAYEFPMSSNTYPQNTNAVLFPDAQGLEIELWRRTPRKGYNRDQRNGTFRIRRAGPTFVPFFRGVSQDPEHRLWFTLNELSSTGQQRRQEYRWCWYDPATGARSQLSSERIVVQSARTERISVGASSRPYRGKRAITIL